MLIFGRVRPYLVHRRLFFEKGSRTSLTIVLSRPNAAILGLELLIFTRKLLHYLWNCKFLQYYNLPRFGTVASSRRTAATGFPASRDRERRPSSSWDWPFQPIYPKSGDGGLTQRPRRPQRKTSYDRILPALPVTSKVRQAMRKLLFQSFIFAAFAPFA